MKDAPPPRASRRKASTHTIHDVAALAGVSSITVSRYFNNPEKVSVAVRERLREIVERIGYVPSQVAGGLASGRGRVVCAVMQNIASATFADLVKGMTDELQASGLQLLLANAQYSQTLEENAIRTFVGWHPRALILTRDDHTPAAEAMLSALDIPVVEAWGFVDDRPFHQVGFPHAETGAQLAHHFLEQGATRVRFVLPHIGEDFRAAQRAQGYAATMTAAGLAADVQVADVEDDFEAGARTMTALAAAPRADRPQAIIFANDNMAAGAILHADDCGLVLPCDCALAGFGDAPISVRLKPALTTLRPARYQIGQMAARTVLRMLAAPQDPTPAPGRALLPCELIVRESSRLTPG
ncbi:LacI family DNA-binding transcriptional regulator [Cupriavidus pauculus]|uniref:LacI family DNA-binding transcriptional regulator n=1 Tax=Cupriavidus pauculus TaxID=82633 RepID=UPI001EE339EA|nr:LacI family DNA-binding transcriptional regulator [Cupriavidus pauculus]GJG97860.1 LacI family DNA-binding transcriptional regulator [Cupriavidus pauculus]